MVFSDAQSALRARGELWMLLQWTMWVSLPKLLNIAEGLAPQGLHRRGTSSLPGRPANKPRPIGAPITGTRVYDSDDLYPDDLYPDDLCI